ncbi:MAG: isopentenyl-diphosphate Delta-isomerase [Planktotalea sp.]|uniref:isopentenyl-diphosphate Delta-isomerase n=1 Tax=Planktotalea sp. TaxID=2029877 RepID=UPI003C79600B
MEIVIPAWVNGVLTPVEKLDAHKRGLRHKAVSVFVFHKGEILIQRRALGKYHTPGLWANTCCTHPHWDEPAETCALRRLEEELGLKLENCTYRGQVEYRADVGNGLIEHELVDVFVAHLNERPATRLNPDEVMGVHWVSYPDLLASVASEPERYTPWLRIYLTDFAEKIFTLEERLP